MNRRRRTGAILAASFAAILYGALTLCAAPKDLGRGSLAQVRAFPSDMRSETLRSDKDPLPQLVREGTKLKNEIGRFVSEGDAAVFVTKGGVEFGGLPNLNLERIVATLKSVDDPQNVWWSVNGTVTEFAGKNYVLISRAVFKATPPPPPQAIPSTESSPSPPGRQ